MKRRIHCELQMRIVVSVLIVLLLFPCLLFAQVTGLEGWNIFLDPGHSQRENMGVCGYSEAERNLRVGLRLREMLLNETDIDTVYISRTNDQQQLSLSQRTDHANRVGAAWFHSIHSDASGPEYNSTLLLWGQYYDGREKIPNGGKAMADIMVDVLTRGMRTNTRGSIGDCSFYTWSDWCQQSGGPYLHVNRNSNMPSELSEAGFHTNPRQNQLFMNADWKRLEARTFYWSILKFHGIERPFVGICTGIVTDEETRVPINGTRVTISGQEYITDTYESLFHNYTDDPDLLHNGFFYFENLRDDALELVVEAEGYIPDTTIVTVCDTFFTFVDVELTSTVPPVIVSTWPIQGDTVFPAWDDIVIEFSRRMNKSAVEAAFEIDPPVDGTFVWSDEERVLTFETDTLDYETEYTISISGDAESRHGYLLDGNKDGIGGDGFVLDFKTGPPDIWPPELVGIYPSQNATNIELHPIINTFYDEELDSSSEFGEVFKLERFLDRTFVPGTRKHYVVNGQSVLSFFPDEKLIADEVYITRLYGGLRDLFGNVVTGGRAFSFSTALSDIEITQIDNFESGTGNWWQPQQSGSTAGIVTESTSTATDDDFVNLLTESTTSLQVDYGWDVNASSWLIRVYLGGGAPKNVRFNSSFTMQVYMFGDGSGNQFRFCVDDNVPTYIAENHEVSPWYTIDWLGWNLISWDMTNDSTGSWIGDGNLDGTLGFDSIQLTYVPGGSEIGTLYFDDLRVVQSLPVGVEEPTAPKPQQFVLHQNYPNPFNPETTIRYSVPGGHHHVVLSVYDVLGNRVKTLIDEEESAGEHFARWDATDGNGNNVASGVYLCKLIVGSFCQVRRMVLVR